MSAFVLHARRQYGQNYNGAIGFETADSIAVLSIAAPKPDFYATIWQLEMVGDTAS